MKALSIQQPWAWLIANRWKHLENRTWNTNFRGDFLIHAGLKIDAEGYYWVLQSFRNIPLPAFESQKKHGFDTGGIVGRATLKDVVTISVSPWFSGPFAFVLDNKQPVPFFPYKGRLGFFECDMNETLWDISK